ncbi:stage V sporulation protein S [Aminipila butyrica]|uniref:Stage V sporulation protein S n=1 Tax=Aminipila butyrica TaxID=433296 RepID=A0A858BSN9_9FIRM|nr:stage V sporulation protein S [Aminipila butyrica]QIB68229.1 stage V sporulation protein S [Aminipila butyrica]
MKTEILKVSATSSPNAVAGSIAAVIQEGKNAEVQAIGAGAVNQAIKAVAIARGYVAPVGFDLVCVPGFKALEIEGKEKTAISLYVGRR